MTNETERRLEVSRLARVCAGDRALTAFVEELISLAERGLPEMFHDAEHEFAHTRERVGRELQALGRSPRYGGITLLGLRHLEPSGQRAILGGELAQDYCGRLIERVEEQDNLGDAALAAWAAAELDHPATERALDRMRTLSERESNPYTVEAAWCVSALVAARERLDVVDEAAAALARVKGAFSPTGDVFAYKVDPARAPRHRAHVACFADQVYPIQALSRFHHAYGDPESLSFADRCGARICELQGDGGQWWWHYDTRTGRVVEGYPVYSVHQNSMAPMALLDLQEAGGTDHSAEIRAGLRWLIEAPETGTSLVDPELALIWRKVARHEPRKLMRRLRALLSRVHPSLRARWLDVVLAPGAIDHESRPYHLGWILHCWRGGL